MSSIAVKQTNTRMTVDECIQFHLKTGRLPDSNKPEETKFYNFIYKQIMRNGKKLPQLIERFKELGVDILAEIQVGRQKNKSTKDDASLKEDDVVKFYETNPEQLSTLLEKLNTQKKEEEPEKEQLVDYPVKTLMILFQKMLQEETVKTLFQSYKDKYKKLQSDKTRLNEEMECLRKLYSNLADQYKNIAVKAKQETNKELQKALRDNALSTKTEFENVKPRYSVIKKNKEETEKSIEALKFVEDIKSFKQLESMVNELVNNTVERNLNDRDLYTARPLFINGKKGEVVKGTNGSMLRVAIHKQSREVFKKVKANWTEEGHLKFKELFPNGVAE